jgi:ribokinase
MGYRSPLSASTQPISGYSAEATAHSRSARQAVAAARLGATVVAVGRASDDELGRRVVVEMKAEGVDCACLRACAEGEPGPGTVDLDLAEVAVARAAVCLLDSELPVGIVEHAIDLCRRHGVEAILDIGSLPEGEVPASLFHVDVLCCGENEAAQLTGLSTAKNIRVVAASLVKRGCRSVVFRLGQHGAYVFSPEGESAVPGFPIPVVDPTAAGDVFAAALAVTRCWGWRLTEAIRFANAAGALACSRTDAQHSMPTLAEVEALLANQA